MVESRFFVGVLSFLSIYLAIYAHAQELDPNYDDPESQVVFYTPDTKSSPLVLSCNVQGEDSNSVVLKWKKEGKDVDDVDSLDGRYKIIDAERKFIIDRPNAGDQGTYSCLAYDQQKDIHAVARAKILRLPANLAVVEGEKMSILCTVEGTQPVVSWNRGNLTLSNSTGRYTLKTDEKGINNAIFVIENVSLDDRGDYECVARNQLDLTNKFESLVSRTTLVRVKGKYAALWPFLGICAEVLVLCVIILVYEKRRNKSEPEESDTDPQDQ